MGFSAKQAQILTFPRTNKTALICDGAVRSGKTSIMSISFILWIMRKFNGQNFAFCGKSVQSVARNIIQPILGIRYFPKYGYELTYQVSKSLLTVEYRGRTNYIYIFGGKDESSYTLIQGITLAGVLLDEVALMPRSFVEQAMARCSVCGAKLWFSCNPESPEHWFYKEWILKAEERNALHIHFLMEDNPGLSAETIERYKRMFFGVFYERYVLGKWVMAEGLIYPMFGTANITDEIPEHGDYYISCDYGTLNPFSAGLWCVTDKKAIRIREYYYSGRDSQASKTDEEYYTELEKLAGELPIENVIVDPSAASFIETIRRHERFSVCKAKNDVLDGIVTTSRYLKAGKILVHRLCKDSIREFGLYRWDEKSAEDKPIKENDHAMDDIRYMAQTILRYRFADDGYKPRLPL